MAEPVVVVVGAGPAGLAASLAAADRGRHVLLVDNAAAPGGQILRQSSIGVAHGAVPAVLRQVAAHPRITLRPRADVVHARQAAPGVELLVRAGERLELVTAGAVVLATGASELALPFPGWDLPGVLTPGAARSDVEGVFGTCRHADRRGGNRALSLAGGGRIGGGRRTRRGTRRGDTALTAGALYRPACHARSDCRPDGALCRRPGARSGTGALRTGGGACRGRRPARAVGRRAHRAGAATRTATQSHRGGCGLRGLGIRAFPRARPIAWLCRACRSDALVLRRAGRWRPGHQRARRLRRGRGHRDRRCGACIRGGNARRCERGTLARRIGRRPRVATPPGAAQGATGGDGAGPRVPAPDRMGRPPRVGHDRLPVRRGHLGRDRGGDRRRRRHGAWCQRSGALRDGLVPGTHVFGRRAAGHRHPGRDARRSRWAISAAVRSPSRYRSASSPGSPSERSCGRWSR